MVPLTTKLEDIGKHLKVSETEHHAERRLEAKKVPKTHRCGNGGREQHYNT